MNGGAATKLQTLAKLLADYPGCGAVITNEGESTLIEVVSSNHVYLRKMLPKAMIESYKYDLVAETLSDMLDQVSSMAGKIDEYVE